MSFFAGVFASLTLRWQWHVSGVALVLPFAISAAIGLVAILVIRRPGSGIRPSPREERAIMWSSIGEGVGLFLVSNLLANLHRPDLLLPAMALVVGVHFLPIAAAGGFRPFYALGAALIAAGCAGLVVVRPPWGGALAGAMAATALWVAAIMALRRDWSAKRAASIVAPEGGGAGHDRRPQGEMGPPIAATRPR